MIEYEYPRPCITADIIVSYKDLVCLVQRKNDPFKGFMALPGGHFDLENDNTIKDAAIRELWEETHIEPVRYIFGTTYNPEALKFKKWYETKGRDPSARTVTFVYRLKISHSQFLMSEAGDDAEQLYWISRQRLPILAFDHSKIVKECW